MLAPGMVTGQLEGALDGFRAGVAVEEAVRPGHGRDCRKAFGQVGQRLVVEVGAGDVDQFRGLLLDSGNNFRVAVAGGRHGDAGGEIEEFVAVDVFNANAAAAVGDQRIGAGVAGGNEAVVSGYSGAGLGTGQADKPAWVRTERASLACSSCVSSTAVELAPGLDRARRGSRCEGIDEMKGRGRRGSSAVQALVAAEEARSRAGGQHAEMPARADAAGARPRPASRRRYGHRSVESMLMHGDPLGQRIPCGLLDFPRDSPAVGGAAVTSVGFPRPGAPRGLTCSCALPSQTPSASTGFLLKPPSRLEINIARWSSIVYADAAG